MGLRDRCPILYRNIWFIHLVQLALSRPFVLDLGLDAIVSVEGSIRASEPTIGVPTAPCNTHVDASNRCTASTVYLDSSLLDVIR